jgi:hypothetical protein
VLTLGLISYMMRLVPTRAFVLSRGSAMRAFGGRPGYRRLGRPVRGVAIFLLLHQRFAKGLTLAEET